MKIYEDNYKVIYYHQKQSMIEDVWQETEKMTNKEYHDEMQNIGNLVVKHRPEKLLVDARKFNFAISPETQEWIDDKIFTQFLEGGLKKLAMIMSPDFIAQLSIEQTMEEEKTGGFETRYFKSKEKGIKWLNA